MSSSEARICAARLTRCDFRYAQLRGATFQDATISDCDFYRCYLIAAEALQAFLYRGLSANVRVTEMSEEGTLGEAPHPGSARGLSILDEFDVASRVKAGRMGRIYELLFCLENSMRELIERTFKESDEFTDWTEGFEEKILKQARKRENEDQDAPWHGPRGGSILSYLDFPQLGEIILGSGTTSLQSVIMAISMLKLYLSLGQNAKSN